MKIITGHQPVYLPWLGLFHKMSLADVFVFMDDVQYLSQDWNNRNRIKGPNGAFWLTVPIDRKASTGSMLKDIRIAKGEQGKMWQEEHWKSIQASYGKACYWKTYAPFFEDMYKARRWERLVDIDEYVLQYLLDSLGIDVEIVKATEYGFAGHKSDLVLDHCRKLRAETCVFGALGRNYVRKEDFKAEGISFYYQDYRHPSYLQRFGDFVSHLSVIDLLFNEGPASRDILLADNVTKSELLDAEARFNEPGEILITHEK